MHQDLNLYKRQFSQAALNNGYSQQNLDKCLDYAEVLINNNVPVIYNLTHLSSLTGFKKGYVIQAAVVSKHSEAYYKYYNIDKKSGGYRTILEPLPNLKDIQRWILENILERINVSVYAKAYKKHTGLKENLKFHRKQKKIVTLDIEDFFPSINRSSVEKIFLEKGYSKLLSDYLSKLCCLKETLPQGAPTSPYISNIVMKEIDNEIGLYCSENQIRFTRYSDDMTFSGDFDEKPLLEFIIPLLKANGFRLNKDKKKVMLNNERQYVTGIIVNDKIQLSKGERRDIRQAMHFINRYGFDNHVETVGINKRNYLNYLIGKIGFGIYLNPNDKNLRLYMGILKKIQKEQNS